jgi:hypothetical protein
LRQAYDYWQDQPGNYPELISLAPPLVDGSKPHEFIGLIPPVPGG